MAINSSFSNRIVDYIFGGVSYVPPKSYYLGISTTPIEADGTGVTEPTDPNYKRVEIPNNKTNFSHAVNGALSVSNEFRFEEAGTNWGTVVDYFITDVPTGNSESLIFGHLQLTRYVEIGTTLVLSPNDFNIEMHTCEME